eukprot:gnl/Chilomastix_caulleri/3105.p2 GENE.gnl/Chilomastix_caulleri/3105~~gnl/Chilomastix_caulleri/3105.p2  ORF type:complete len:82 (-),score=17.72 gnl/Chilomastix_caulleri/3105:126-371(-)
MQKPPESPMSQTEDSFMYWADIYGMNNPEPTQIDDLAFPESENIEATPRTPDEHMNNQYKMSPIFSFSDSSDVNKNDDFTF